MGHPRSLFHLFSSFQTNITILQQIHLKNVHPVYSAGIWTNDLWNMSLLPQPQDQDIFSTNMKISMLIQTYDLLNTSLLQLPLNLGSRHNNYNFVYQEGLKAHSHYWVFRVCLWQTVAFLQGDRKFPISALTQPIVENADAASRVNQPSVFAKCLQKCWAIS